MEKQLIQIRKHAGEEYKFYLYFPSYDGEVGCLNIEIEPYIEVETPENCFGYSDYVRLCEVLKFNEKGKPYYDIEIYTSYRYLQPYIKRKLKRQMLSLYKKLKIDNFTRLSLV